MKTRRDIKMLAKARIKAQRRTAILLVLVMALKIFVLGALDRFVLRKLGWAPSVLVYWAFMLPLLVLLVGVMQEYIKIYRGEPSHVMALYADFKVRFRRKLGGMLWMMLWIALWALISVPIIVLAIFLMSRTGRGMRLFILVLMGPIHLAAIVPVIIKGLSYFMTPFILADRPDVTARGALTLSRQMMVGHRGRLFVMMLSFIGWMFLSALTFGILYVVYVGPYMATTYAGFYDEVRGGGSVAPEEPVAEVEAEAETEDEGEIEEDIEVEIVEEIRFDDTGEDG